MNKKLDNILLNIQIGATAIFVLTVFAIVVYGFTTLF